MEQSETQQRSTGVIDFAEVVQRCLSCAVIVVDAHRLICAFNSEAERMTNLRVASVLGQPIQSLPPSLKGLIEETFASNAPILAREIVGSAREDAAFFLRASSTPCAGTDGQAVGVVVVMNERTPAHQLGIHAQRLDRLASLGTIAASMAHEIKNALVAVNTFVEDLIHHNKDSELAGLVAREIRRIDTIVNQMLKFVGPAQPTFSPVSVHRVLEQSLRLIGPQIEARKVVLRCSLVAGPDVVQADENQLEQAFLNILLNALAAMDEAGILTVSTELAQQPYAGRPETAAPHTLLQVNISDTGPGIAPEIRDRLFEPFFTTKPQGTGLGLAITRRIILEHQGTIELESTLGKGTTFRISLPLTSPDSPRAH